MANVRLKLTALSPIHIGSGEVYEPTNFIMDEGVLYTDIPHPKTQKIRIRICS